mgnify:CR=1 FL=1
MILFYGEGGDVISSEKRNLCDWFYQSKDPLAKLGMTDSYFLASSMAERILAMDTSAVPASICSKVTSNISET